MFTIFKLHKNSNLDNSSSKNLVSKKTILKGLNSKRNTNKKHKNAFVGLINKIVIVRNIKLQISTTVIFLKYYKLLYYKMFHRTTS